MTITITEVRAQIAAGVRVIAPAVDLSGADLSGADLRWADLSGADLRWAALVPIEVPQARRAGL